MLQVAVLAGGLATRLGSLARGTPKALVLVAGEPFIFHQLRLLHGQGVRRILLCLGHLGEQIRSAVGDGRRFGLGVEYSFDGSEPAGTGGALLRALPWLDREFFVIYGDSYTPCCFSAVQQAYGQSRRPALMTVLRNDNRWDRSNVALHDDGRVEYDKNSGRSDLSHIDFGLSVLSRDVLRRYSSLAQLDLSQVWRELSVSGELACFEVFDRFYEVGSHEGLADAGDYLASHGRH